MQAFFVIAFLKFWYLAAKSGEVLDLVSILRMICVVAYCHRFATGEISQDGVRFRRFFANGSLPGRMFAKYVGGGALYCSFLRKAISSHVGSASFLNPLTSIPYWRHRQGLDTPLLPILDRIHAPAGETPEIVSAAAQPRWMVRGFTPHSWNY
jgi:hypothetical protein